MLAWYFYHASYSGNSVFTQDMLDRYITEISKPGFLRSVLGYFDAETVGKDTIFFQRYILVMMERID
jgi:hypothetical protein